MVRKRVLNKSEIDRIVLLRIEKYSINKINKLLNTNYDILKNKKLMKKQNELTGVT